jgi:hypothetical protein
MRLGDAKQNDENKHHRSDLVRAMALDPENKKHRKGIQNV